MASKMELKKKKNIRSTVRVGEGKDISIEKTVAKQKYVAWYGFFTWWIIGYVILQAVSFNMAGFGAAYFILGLMEFHWFAIIGGFFCLGLAKIISTNLYNHPDSDIREYQPYNTKILDTLFSEGEVYVRGNIITDGPSENIIGEAEKAGKKGASAVHEYFHDHLPHREHEIGFGGDMPATMLAGAPFPYSLENRSLFCVGSAGSGKSQVFKELIYDVRERSGRDRFIFYDRKPEYLPMFFRKGDRIICPADIRHTDWDLFSEIDGEQDVDNIVKTLIPDAAKEGSSNDKFWVDSARNVFRAIMVWLLLENEKAYKQGLTKHPKPSNEEFCKFIAQTVSDPARLWGVLNQNETTAYLGNCLSSSTKQGSSTANSIIGSLTSYTQSFTRPEVAERGAFSIREWLHDPETEGRAIFLSNPAKYGDNYASYFTMIVNIAMTEMISIQNDNNRRVWFILDEFGSLMRTGIVPRLLAEGRSKGACTVIGTQDIAQIKGKYDKEATTILNNCNSQCIARITDPEEADIFVKSLGDIEVEKQESTEDVNLSSKDTSYKISDRNNASKREKRALALNSEITGLQDLTYYVKMGDLGWFKNKIQYYPWNNHDYIPSFIMRPTEYFKTGRLLENMPSYIAEALKKAQSRDTGGRSYR